MIDLYASAGADASLKIFPKSNHFFSHNGKIVKGVAFNGCGDNPVIIGINNSLKFLDGSQANPKIVRKKCLFFYISNADFYNSNNYSIL